MSIPMSIRFALAATLVGTVAFAPAASRPTGGSMVGRRNGVRTKGCSAGRRRDALQLSADGPHRARRRRDAQARARARQLGRLPADRRRQALAMGDLVLLDNEVGPVMAALQDGGVEQSALHNHLIRIAARDLHAHHGARRRGQDRGRLHAALRQERDAVGAPRRAGAASAGDLTPRRSPGRSAAGQAQRRRLSGQRPAQRDDQERASRFRRRWASRRRSTSSLPAPARRRSPATSCCAEAR